MADLRPLPGLSADWVLPPLSALRGCPVACAWRGARSRGAEPPRAPGLPAPPGAHTPRGEWRARQDTLPGVGPPHLLTPGWARGPLFGVGGEGRFGETCSLGTPNRREGAKGFLSCQCTPPTILDRDPVSFGVRPSLCRREGGGSDLRRRGGDPGARVRRTRGPRRGDSGYRALSAGSWG